MKLQLNVSSEDHKIARLAALAIGIHVIESLIPSPIPGIKPGFANIVILIVFAIYGLNSAAWVSMLRVIVGSIVIGTFLSPTFVLSLSGACGSLLVLVFFSHQAGMRVSLFGIAILMSMANMVAQYIMVYWFFIPHEELINILPILLTAALIFGVFTGLIAEKVYQNVKSQLC